MSIHIPRSPVVFLHARRGAHGADRSAMKIKQKPKLSKSLKALKAKKTGSGVTPPKTQPSSAAGTSQDGGSTAMRRLGGIAKSKGKGKLSRKHALLPQLQDEVDQRIELAKQRKLERRQQAREAAGSGEMKAAVLDSMKASLEELLEANEEHHTKEWRARKRSLTSKARSRIVVQETAHLQQVLDHPAFKADPFAALNEHIRNIVDASNANAHASSQHPQHQAGGALARKRGRE